MNYEKRSHKFVFLYKKHTFFYFLYTVLVFVLAHCVWPNFQNSEFSIYQYVLDSTFEKTLACIAFAIIIFVVINNRYTDGNTFSEKVVLFIAMLYFIPGLAICSALNVDWTYIIAYMTYFVVLVVSDVLIKRPQKAPTLLMETHTGVIILLLISVCLLYPFVLMFVYNRGFSLADILLTLNDPYGIRAQAREKSISWAFLLIENWGVYFGALMITHSLKNRKYGLAVAFIIIQFFYFSLQGNRIFLFITGIAIVLGLIKISSKAVSYAFVGLLLVQILEYFVFQSQDSIGLVTNIFRRFTIVPNIISPKYFDFFKTNTPDYLRGHFEWLSTLLGNGSEYGFDIGYVIGEQYFHMNLNANTGMVGGAFFEFGYLGVVIDPIMMVVSLRIFDKILIRAEKEYSVLIAFIYTSLAINSWALWSQCIRVSYILLLIVSIYLLFNTGKSMEKTSKIRCVR